MSVLSPAAEEPQSLPANFLDDLGSLESREDVVSWLNGVLSMADDASPILDLNSLDKHVSRVVASLDVASEDVSSQLERLIDDISRSASRLSYDLHFMRDGALSLQVALNALDVRNNSSQSAETSQALDKLHSLDIIKTHMETARDVLQEAESWSTLESEIASLLSEQSYEKAAEKLSEANKSMVVFQNTSDYEHRRALMVSLQNQLEASLSSALIAAINSQDVAVCRNYYTIFHNIQRDSEFRTYYYGSRRSGLVTMWQEASLSDDGDSPSSPSVPTGKFSVFLSDFFSSFLTNVSSERTSISAIFPDPQQTLSTFVTTTMEALQPMFSERLSAISHHYGSSALLELIATFKATEQFAVSADKILERTEHSSALATSPPEGNSSENASLSRSHSRRRSHRLSMSASRRMGAQGVAGLMAKSGGSGLDWDQPLFEPFLEYQVEYGTLEKRLLDKQLSDLLSTEETTSDHARRLRERSLDVLSLGEESLARVLAFTHGYGIVGLVHALDEFFEGFLESSKARLSDQSSSTARPLSASTSGDDLADLDYTLEDWNQIQMWLHLLESLRTVLERVTIFEAKLRSVIYQVAGTLRSPQADLTAAYIPGTRLEEILKDVEPDSRPPSHDSIARSLPKSTRPPLTTLLVRSHAAVNAFAVTVQKTLQDAMLAPLRKHLAQYASSSLWTASKDARQKRSRAGATSDIQVPMFSLSPSEMMQHVAEGLLNLPRLFEVYAADDVLAFSVDTLPFIDNELLQALLEQTADAQATHSRRQSMSVKSAPPQQPTPGFTPEDIASIWLSSLGRSLLSHFTSSILPSIRSLSTDGAAQLGSDLSYLSNIIGALNVQSEELEKWKEYVALDDEDGRKHVSEVDPGNSVFAQVARMRRWIFNGPL
ncbi:hypothetical protein EVG20_g6212 [Dentipellis fragilis]|uniref:Conserved oligomeric Golgi complex subunit 7 n=1 Tax=Dentipellis fragilis TaxID=205917 RepID=A0A4Y9YPN5_9AGAM|nr:hypothetical protein EVG20_g6212 [Dentipellis fragilis]